MNKTTSLPLESAEQAQMETEIWQYDDIKHLHSTTYVNIYRHSAEITDHLSTQHLQIVSGIGYIATEGIIIPVKKDHEVTILPGTKHWYSGDFCMLITRTPAYNPSFVMYGDQKLGHNETKLLRKNKINQQISKLATNIFDILNSIEESRHIKK